jgi:S-adenosylmethionine:tRNA-ribosyltransferase-isomerase (queuine synthetase)
MKQRILISTSRFGFVSNFRLPTSYLPTSTEYWLEILIESEVVEKARFYPLLQEVEEIVKILVASTRKIKERLNGSKSNGKRIEMTSEKQ